MSALPFSQTNTAPGTKPVKPHKVSLWGTRAILDPRTYTPDMANTLAPWTKETGALTGLLANRAGAIEADSGLYDRLNQQAQSDLALGGELNAEEARAATQGARAAFSSRGLVNAPMGIIGEIMRRAAASNARQRERQGFAAGVEQLRQKRQEASTGLLGILGNLSTAGTQQAEDIRQFELERDDQLKFNDKSAAVSLKTGQGNAAAATAAGKGQAIGAGVGTAAGLAVGIAVL